MVEVISSRDKIRRWASRLLQLMG